MRLSVGFSTTNSLISRAIRWFIKAKVSHTYLRVYDAMLQETLIIHADYPGVIVETVEQFDFKNRSIEEYEINDEKLKIGLRKNLKHLGKKYDYWTIFHWAWVLTFKRWLKKKVKSPTQNPKKLICVDFVIHVLNDSEITHLPVGQMHPKNLRTWFKKNHKQFGWKRVNFEEEI